jgi:hypothetical protein
MMNVNQCSPDAAQRDSDAPLIRGRSKLRHLDALRSRRSRVCSASFHAALRPGKAIKKQKGKTWISAMVSAI